MAPISQREARRLMKRVAALEQVEARRRNAWATEWPGGVEIARVRLEADAAASVRTARKLSHAVVALEADGVVRFIACPLPEEL